MTNRIRHLATSACKRNVVLVEAFPLLVKRARDVHGVCAFRSTTGQVGGKHLWSFMYQPAVFLSLIHKSAGHVMASQCTNQLQGFPQCRGLISSLGTPRITSTDIYWVYPSAFYNRALNQSLIDRLPVVNYSFSSYH
ncbi:unnamed protein product [Prunus armeniaca]